jgi:hypothetical protein
LSRIGAREQQEAGREQGGKDREWTMHALQ